jgi:hypothetical protein
MVVPDWLEEVRVFVDHLRATFRDFDRRWRLDWESDDEDRLVYMEGSTIARYLADLVEFEPDSDAVNELAEEIEGAFTSGLDDNWLQIGLIESIQNIVSNEHLRGTRAITASEVKKRLGPQTCASWEDLDRRWGNPVDDV